MTQKHREQLSIQNSAEETHKEESTLLKREPIQNTPFHMVQDQRGWFITIGDYRITEPYEKELDALLHLESKMWIVIMQMIGCALDRWDEKIKPQNPRELQMDIDNRIHLHKKLEELNKDTEGQAGKDHDPLMDE